MARASLPLALNPPDLWFSCALHAYARLHTPRMSLLSDVLFSERLARQGPSSIVILPLPLVSVFVSSISAGLDDESVSHLFLSYLIINHLLGTSASSRHFARCRTQIGSAGVHSQVEMTGAALLGRRWADRLCRDRTVSVLV